VSDVNGLYEWTPGKGASFRCSSCKRVWAITPDEYHNRYARCADCEMIDIKKHVAEQRARESLEYRMKALDRGIKALGYDTAMTKEQQEAAMTMGILILEEEGIVDPSLRWMQLIYGTPMLYTPKKNVTFKNVGK
jgi:hypothetical protein